MSFIINVNLSIEVTVHLQRYLNYVPVKAITGYDIPIKDFNKILNVLSSRHIDTIWYFNYEDFVKEMIQDKSYKLLNILIKRGGVESFNKLRAELLHCCTYEIIKDIQSKTEFKVEISKHGFTKRFTDIRVLDLVFEEKEPNIDYFISYLYKVYENDEMIDTVIRFTKTDMFKLYANKYNSYLQVCLRHGLTQNHIKTTSYIIAITIPRYKVHTINMIKKFILTSLSINKLEYLQMLIRHLIELEKESAILESIRGPLYFVLNDKSNPNPTEALEYVMDLYSNDQIDIKDCFVKKLIDEYFELNDVDCFVMLLTYFPYASVILTSSVLPARSDKVIEDIYLSEPFGTLIKEVEEEYREVEEECQLLK